MRSRYYAVFNDGTSHKVSTYEEIDSYISKMKSLCAFNNYTLSISYTGGTSILSCIGALKTLTLSMSKETFSEFRELIGNCDEGSSTGGSSHEGWL